MGVGAHSPHFVEFSGAHKKSKTLKRDSRGTPGYSDALNHKQGNIIMMDLLFCVRNNKDNKESIIG